ncbi:MULTISPECIES: fructose-bisphosphate aldolase [unclassified Pseudomonas]|uniref:fructose-bisphosphate aldolase n=1 Tax=unclassified Pseudomonas TaxID=196821 RepID=UPI0030DB65DD
MTVYQPASSETDTPPSRAALLLIDSDAPLRDRHSCLRECLNAVLEHLNLMACSSLQDVGKRDLNNVANTARILVQDVSDVFRVIEHRSFDTADAAL